MNTFIAKASVKIKSLAVAASISGATAAGIFAYDHFTRNSNSDNTIDQDTKELFGTKIEGVPQSFAASRFLLSSPRICQALARHFDSNDDGLDTFRDNVVNTAQAFKLNDSVLSHWAEVNLYGANLATLLSSETEVLSQPVIHPSSGVFDGLDIPSQDYSNQLGLVHTFVDETLGFASSAPSFSTDDYFDHASRISALTELHKSYGMLTPMEQEELSKESDVSHTPLYSLLNTCQLRPQQATTGSEPTSQEPKQEQGQVLHCQPLYTMSLQELKQYGNSIAAFVSQEQQQPTLGTALAKPTTGGTDGDNGDENQPQIAQTSELVDTATVKTFYTTPDVDVVVLQIQRDSANSLTNAETPCHIPLELNIPQLSLPKHLSPAELAQIDTSLLPQSAQPAHAVYETYRLKSMLAYATHLQHPQVVKVQKKLSSENVTEDGSLRQTKTPIFLINRFTEPQPHSVSLPTNLGLSPSKTTELERILQPVPDSKNNYWYSMQQPILPLKPQSVQSLAQHSYMLMYEKQNLCVEPQPTHKM